MTRDEVLQAEMLRDCGLTDRQIAQQLAGSYEHAWLIDFVLRPENYGWYVEGTP